MALVRWNPALSMLGRWPSIWDEDELPNLPASNNLDVYETEDEVVVRANVAGVPTDKVDITFEKGVLWIQAAAEAKENDEKTTHYSRSSWSYSYKVAVPGELNHAAEPSAEVENGVLTVTFKKAEAAKPRKLSVVAKK